MNDDQEQALAQHDAAELLAEVTRLRAAIAAPSPESEIADTRPWWWHLPAIIVQMDDDIYAREEWEGPFASEAEARAAMQQYGGRADAQEGE